jgi:hypothetical protein
MFQLYVENYHVFDDQQGSNNTLLSQVLITNSFLLSLFGSPATVYFLSIYLSSMATYMNIQTGH